MKEAHRMSELRSCANIQERRRKYTNRSQLLANYLRTVDGEKRSEARGRSHPCYPPCDTYVSVAGPLGHKPYPGHNLDQFWLPCGVAPGMDWALGAERLRCPPAPRAIGDQKLRPGVGATSYRFSLLDRLSRIAKRGVTRLESRFPPEPDFRPRGVLWNRAGRGQPMPAPSAWFVGGRSVRRMLALAVRAFGVQEKPAGGVAIVWEPA
jgi:hypothetical protein